MLIWAAMSLILIAGIVVAGSSEFKALDALSETEYGAGGQAQAVAEAGLVDAYAWLRRQATQPVTAFTPQLDLDADPEVNETDDPAVGLVRTFEIAPGLWARYSVARGEPAEAFTDANGNGVFDEGEAWVDTDGDGKRSPGEGTRDVSTERGLPGQGTVWLLESRARIFRRSNLSLPLGAGPNVQVASAKMATEVRRLVVVPPAAAALCSRRGDNATVGTRGRIRGDTAIGYGENTGSPVTSGGEVPGARVPVPGYKDYVEDVFGVEWSMLKSMADISTTDPVDGVPVPIPNFSLVVVQGDVTFTKERPLRGTCILIVQGNCTIESGSNSFFNGVLYVDGDLTARAPAYLRGTVIVSGQTSVSGTGGDYCEIEHDASTINLLQVKMGQYRYTKSRYIPAPKFEDGRADEGVTITAALDKLPLPDAGDLDGAFQTDALIDAINALFEADPKGPGADKLEDAAVRLEQARNYLLREPPEERDAVHKVKDAMKKLKEAADDGADVTGLYAFLTGGEGKLFDDMVAMVDRLINESTAKADDIADARARYDIALAELADAAAFQSAGQHKDAFRRYEEAAHKLDEALGKIGL